MAAAGFSPKTMHNYLQVVKWVVASAVDAQGEQLFPRKWNHEFIDLPEIGAQRTPIFTAEEVTRIVSTSEGQFSILYALLAGTGLRIGEALALEVKDISELTVTVRQGIWNGIIQSPKTSNGLREIDLHPSLAALLNRFIGARRSGFIFQSSTGELLSTSNVRNRNLHPILQKLGIKKQGFHGFRRFRVTHLRKNRLPEDLLRFWIGHANTSVTDQYSKMNEDIAFRLECAEEAGLGFELPHAEIPAENSVVVPSCTQSVLLSEVA